MKKIIKHILITILILALIITILIIAFYKRADKTGYILGPVEDYSQKENIWTTIYGNNKTSKLDNMNIDYNSDLIKSAMKFWDILTGNYKDVEKEIDTLTYYYEIKGGYEKTTYEDEPYIIPYLTNKSTKSVIILSGGGFIYKSMDGETKESKDVAIELNKQGINAFLLHYRSNPYEWPISYLDLQRAIRYIRYNSDKYQIDKNNISIIGFSAGGNVVSTYINQIMGKNLFDEGYSQDNIDLEDDTITKAAMIYTAINFNNNPTMLFTMFPSKDVKNAQTRTSLLDKTDNVKHFSSSNIKQYISYGGNDQMVGTEEINKYIKKCEETNTSITKRYLEKEGHGFETQKYIDNYINWLQE